MHQPPAVRVVVAPTRWQGRCVVLLALATLCQTAFFLAANLPTSPLNQLLLMAFAPLTVWRIVVVGAGLAISLGLGWWWSRQSDSGSLSWDGTQWCWLGCHGSWRMPIDITLHLDLQRFLLIALRQPGHATVWLGLRQRELPDQWMPLRRAITYHATHRSAPENALGQISAQGGRRASADADAKIGAAGDTSGTSTTRPAVTR